jgi:DUF1680 family protein
MKGLENLLKTASGKLGMSPEKLMDALEKKDVNSILSRMSTDDKQKIKSVLESGSAMNVIMNNPMAADFMRQMGKK